MEAKLRPLKRIVDSIARRHPRDTEGLCGLILNTNFFLSISFRPITAEIINFIRRGKKGTGGGRIRFVLPQIQIILMVREDALSRVEKIIFDVCR